MASSSGNGFPPISDPDLLDHAQQDVDKPMIDDQFCGPGTLDEGNAGGPSRSPEAKTGDMALASHLPEDLKVAFMPPSNAEIIDVDSFPFDHEQFDQDPMIKQEPTLSNIPALAPNDPRSNRPRWKPKYTPAQKDRILAAAHEAAQKAKNRPVLNTEKPKNLTERFTEDTAPLECSDAPLQSKESMFTVQHDLFEEDSISDAEAREAEKFAKVKAAYERKAATGQAQYQDFLEFMNAQKAEEKRLQSLKHAETTPEPRSESSPGLFVTDADPEQPESRRRRRGPEQEPEPEPSDESDFNPLNSNLNSFDVAPAAKRARKASTKGLDAEILRQGLSVGIEDIALRKEKKGRKPKKPKDKSEPKPSEKKEKSTKRGKAGGKRATTGSNLKTSAGVDRNRAPATSRRHKGPQMMSTDDIWDTSNIGEDANANLDRKPLPALTETKKREAFGQLFSVIPLDDQSIASKEIKHLKEATIKLGKRRCMPDGKGNWKLKGMLSSLR